MGLVADKYEPVRRLGTGGMAEVYLARQRGAYGFERYVVLKRLLPHLAGREEFVSMFLDEARIAADLRHVNVVSTLDIGEDAGGLYLVLEYLEGCTVRELQGFGRRRGERLEPGHALRICADAARGLAYAHDKRDTGGVSLAIVHRDVSPENLFVGRDGVTRVLDFGIAKASMSLAATSAGQLKGKFAYMSPEQASGGEVGAASDQFALALVLYELLSGRRAYDQPTDAELYDSAVTGSVPLPLGIDDGELVAIIERATAVTPDDRYPDCGALADALEAALDGRAPARNLGAIVGEAMRIAHDDPAVGTAATSAAPAVDTIATPGAPSMATPSLVGLERNNLPDQASSFVGRRAELDALGERWSAGTRATTLVGTGGIGKTRLALHFAHKLAMTAHPPGGIWLCELVNATHLRGVCQAIAAPLRATLDASDDRDVIAQVAAALSARGPTLLILDNAEHVIAPTRRVVEALLQQAPELRVLVTSRERLGLAREHVLELGPLSGSSGAFDEAVELFYERARQSAPRRPLTEAHAEIVERIVARLDGIPLAVELAAARLRVLSPEQLHDRLDRALDLLKRRQSAGAKHGALRGTLDWSWNLLDEAEKTALRQCSVFRGGFDIEAAEAVIDVPDGGPLVIDLVEALREKSLLRESAIDDALRFDMYETIRDYAAERLEEAGEVDTTRARHAAHYLELCAPLAEAAIRDPYPATLAPLAVEADNLVAIYRNGVDIARAIRLLEPVMARGQTPRATYLERVGRAIDAATDPDDRATLLWRRARSRGAKYEDYEGAVADVEAALEVADRPMAARLHAELAVAASVAQVMDRAEAELARARSLLEEIDDPCAELLAAYAECGIRFRSRKSGFGEIAERGVKRARELGWKYWELQFLTYKHIAVSRGPQAREILEQSLALDPEDIAAHYNLGCLLNVQGDFAGARRSFDRTLRLARARGHHRAVTLASLDIAFIDAQTGHVRAARRTLDELAEAATVPWVVAWVALIRATIEARESKADEAQRWLERAVELASKLEDPELGQAIEWVRGDVHLARGELERARELADTGGEPDEDWALVLRRDFRERLAEAEAEAEAQ